MDELGPDPHPCVPDPGGRSPTGPPLGHGCDRAETVPGSASHGGSTVWEVHTRTEVFTTPALISLFSKMVLLSMFSNDSASADESTTNVTTSIVSEGATIEGVLEFSSVDLRIEGTVYGDITTDGRVVVSKGAEVQGTVNAHTIQIAGRVEGHIQAEEELILCPPSKVHATLEAEVLEIQPGADFSGEVPTQEGSDLKEKEEIPSESDVEIPNFVPESALPELDNEENGEVEVAA